jgi:hypothetical protein
VKKIKGILHTLVVVALILGGLFTAAYAGYFSIVPGQLDVSTDIRSLDMYCDCFTSMQHRYSWGYSGSEMLQHDYITSWDINGQSELISLNAGYRPGHWTLFQCCAWCEMPHFGSYYWKVELSTQNQGPGEWISIIDKTGIIRPDLVNVISGPVGLNHDWVGASVEHDTPGGSECSSLIAGDQMHILTLDDIPQNSSTIFPASALNIKVKGQQYGGIRATLMLNVQTWIIGNSYVPGVYACVGTTGQGNGIPLVSDEAYLYSGIGSIEILDNPQAPPGMEDYYEEGQTVVTRINTGAAGSGGNHGWLVTATRGGTGIPSMSWSHSGTTYTTDANGNFMVNSNLVDYDISWTVPNDWYNPSGSNDIIMTLTNQIIQQDRDDTFTLYEGGFEDAPGETTLEILNLPANGHFLVGDTVLLKATANINEQANPPHNTIWGFELSAYSSNPYHTYYQGYQNSLSNCGGTCRYAQFSFLVDTDAETMVLKARAWSGDPNAGGLPGGYGEDAVQIGEPGGDGLTLTVKVKALDDGITHLLRGAEVTVSDEYVEFTDKYGSVIIADLVEGTYMITASKDGYRSASESFDLTSGNTQCVLTLTAGSDFMLLIVSIVIPVIVLIIFLVVAILMVPPWRYILLVVGISMSALLFYLCYFTTFLSSFGI